MKIRKMIACLFLSMTMVVTFIPVTSFAGEEENIPSPLTVSDGIDETKADMENQSKVIVQRSSNELNGYGGVSQLDDVYDDVEEYDYNIGNTETGTVGANSAVAYRMSDQGNESYQIIVNNLNKSEEDELTIYVMNDNGGKKYSISFDDVINYRQSGSGEDGDVFSLEGGSWNSWLFTLDMNDYIVLAADNTGIEYSMIVQGIKYSYVGHTYGCYEYGLLYHEAQLIPFGLYDGDPTKAVLYLKNNSDIDCSFSVVSSDGQWIKDIDGHSRCELKSDYHIDAGYNFNKNQNYYLFLFNYPGQTCSSRSSDVYNPTIANKGYNDYTFAMIPQALNHYGFKFIKNKTYSGKALKQNVVLEYGNFQLGKGNYSISYSNNKNVGTATITFKGKRPYSGTVKKTFKINPKGTKLSKVRASKGAIKVTWTKQKKKMSKARITGYQIQYSTDERFKSGTKIITVKGYKQTSKKIRKLKKKKRYYVRVRTYMKVGKKKYYSNWSKDKSVRTR